LCVCVFVGVYVYACVCVCVYDLQVRKPLQTPYRLFALAL